MWGWHINRKKWLNQSNMVDMAKFCLIIMHVDCITMKLGSYACGMKICPGHAYLGCGLLCGDEIFIKMRSHDMQT